mmetsp:Transcript_32201/g.46462  ORF Transcript_32201/g.46462 Transcript_32201/m.46462 type:complete len:81 (+) Transcript_32201:3181-3423(+)
MSYCGPLHYTYLSAYKMSFHLHNWCTLFAAISLPFDFVYCETIYRTPFHCTDFPPFSLPYLESEYDSHQDSYYPPIIGSF